MGGDVTNEVLAERIANFSNDLHDDLGRIEKQLALLVPREVYDAHRVADAARIVALERRADQSEQERRQMLRWLIGTVAIPILLAVWQLWLASRGGKP